MHKTCLPTGKIKIVKVLRDMSRIVYFAKKYFQENYPAIFICLFFFAISFFAVNGFDLKNLKYSGDSITSDEVPHITSGFYYLKTGRYFLNPEHPPLVKDISAILPLFVLNPSFPEVSCEYPSPKNEEEKEDLFFNKNVFPRDLEVTNYHWDNRMLIFNPQNNPDLIILLARLGVILFNSALLFVLYLLLKKHWGKKTAALSLFFAAIPQFNIAHGSLVTTDFAASVLQLCALASFGLFLKLFGCDSKKKIFLWLFISSFFFALAFAAKFSSLVLIPISFVGGLIFILAVKKFNFKNLLFYLFSFVVLIAFSFSLIIFYYSFHAKNMDAEGIISQIDDNYPKKFPAAGKVFLNQTAEGNRFEKAVSTYGIGLSMTINRINSAGQSTYFMGKVYGSEGAGFWYFPIIYFTKIPLPIHTLTLLSFALFLFFLSKRVLKKEFWLNLNLLDLFLFVFVGFYSYKSISSNLNIGLRHFMPVVFAISALTARGTVFFWNEKVFKKIKMAHITFAMLAIMLTSTIISFPHYLSYYNISIGGTNNGYKIATDSNYDWGQDIKRLGKFVHDSNIEKIYVHLFSANKLDYYLDNKYQSFNIEYDDLSPAGFYLAVSAQEFQNNIYNLDLPENKKYSQFKNNIAARAGKSIFIFKIP